MTTVASEPGAARASLVDLLQRAYSGELAAALAYAGHWRSVPGECEREDIRRIEAEELDHRERVGRILAALGSGPHPRRERNQRRVGRFIGWICHWTGWLIPMYGAGRLERMNIVEYEVAARLARAAGRREFCDDLLDMAEVEWDHERYFRAKVRGHWLGKRLPIWSPPPPREAIRTSFAADA